MTGKRGLSLEEKRIKVLEIFHDSSDVFLLKDVEKLAVKKGVTFQSVKDVVQSLVDDDLLHQEKIGTSNYFWAFPSEASVKLELSLKAERNKLDASTVLKTELEEQIKSARAQRTNVEEMESKLNELSELKARKQVLASRLQQLEGCDPVRFAQICTAIPAARDSANRWLDNITSLQDWTKKKFEGKEADVDKFFAESGLADDMDYMD